MKIEVYTSKLSECLETLTPIYSESLSISQDKASKILENELSSHLENIRPDCWVLIETNYVDKLYRNSYYNYFASKHNRYEKNCIRLSFFKTEVSYEDFRSEERAILLQEKYLGFLIIRPIKAHIVGRSGISKEALRERNFLTCECNIKVTANSVKLSVNAFPHCSQDTETISCAETSIWSIMEYFSNKYQEYESVLPSDITVVLKRVTNQRQLPSNGLTCDQISFALKQFGFEPQIYEMKTSVDERILSCYIESGIPVVITVSNDAEVGETLRNKGVFQDSLYSSDVAHAFLATGHEDINNKKIKTIKKFQSGDKVLDRRIARRGVTISDYDSISKKFVFIDDNLPVFKMGYLSSPMKLNYSEAEWKKCKITHFIVPLYRRIHLTAEVAKQRSLQILLSNKFTLRKNSSLIVRTYLCSSRSYKHYIAVNPDLSEDLKEMFLDRALPKFIWVTEVFHKSLIINKKCSGLIVLDATEADSDSGYESVILAVFENFLLDYDYYLGFFKKIKLSLQPFKAYFGNLN